MSLVLKTTTHGVTTLTMNLPARLNGWTFEMMEALRIAMEQAANSDDTKVLVITGADPYYCAGVNLSSTMRLAHPKKLHAQIVEANQGIFDRFIQFPKPILIACNGPAIGACVTSATLCDGIIASEKATLSTPFAALGVTPEGCSSVLFARLMGEETAKRMLGPEGWKPSGDEAKAIGLVQRVVPHEDLLAEAQKMAEQWITDGRTRTFRGEGTTKEELLAVNARESVILADAFLSPPFLKGQYEFLRRKKKRGPATMFYMLWKTQPLWGMLK